MTHSAITREYVLDYVDIFSGDSKSVTVKASLDIYAAPDDYIWHCRDFHRTHYPAQCNWCHRNSVKAAAEGR